MPSGYPKRPPIDTPKTPVRTMLRAAADIWDVPVRDIASKSRYKAHVRPRQAICNLAYGQGWSTTQIARILGYSDHSSILYARDIVPVYYEHDPLFAARFNKLSRQCKAPERAYAD